MRWMEIYENTKNTKIKTAEFKSPFDNISHNFNLYILTYILIKLLMQKNI
jgi:hypothetical protein